MGRYLSWIHNPLFLGATLLVGAANPLHSQHQEAEGFVSVDGGSLYYRESGEGDPVILLHGGFLDHRMWDSQVRALSEGHRVIRYDIRHHGRSKSEPVASSDMEDLAVLMDSLEVSRATLVGLSMGGQIAIDFALLWPGRVESLVLVGPGLSGYRLGSSALQGYLEEIGDAIDRVDFRATIEVFTRYWCDGPYRTPAEVDPEVREKVLEMLAGSRDRWDNNRLVQPLDPPAMDRTGSIGARTLVVLGTVDMPDIRSVVEHLEATIPNVQRVDIPAVAHMVNLETPHRFNRLLLGFLEGD